MRPTEGAGRSRAGRMPGPGARRRMAPTAARGCLAVGQPLPTHWGKEPGSPGLVRRRPGGKGRAPFEPVGSSLLDGLLLVGLVVDGPYAPALLDELLEFLRGHVVDREV